ncbi:hypothetical protein [Vibrio owensii]|uniref:hypothetical protein n=1 Tax=Vibrio owensii TaxID=696485 RepID=UPI003CC6C22D
MDNTKIQYLNELDVAMKSLSVLRGRIEASLKVPVLDQMCVHSELKQSNRDLELPFDNKLPYIGTYMPASIGIVGLTTLGMTNSFTLSAIFSAITYAGIELRRRWVSERLENLMFLKQTKLHLHNIAGHIKYLDALGVSYSAKSIKQLLYRALKSEQHLSGAETILLMSELWNAFVSNDDLSKLRESAFDSLYVPEEFAVPIDFDEDDDEEYLDLLFEEDDEFESVRDDADKMEARFEELFCGMNVDENPTTTLDKTRFAQEVSHASTERFADSQMESVMAEFSNPKAPEVSIEKAGPRQLVDPFSDVIDEEPVELEISTTPQPQVEPSAEEPNLAPEQDQESDLLDSSLSELLSDENAPLSSVNADAVQNEAELSKEVEKSDIETQPSSETDSSIANDHVDIDLELMGSHEKRSDEQRDSKSIDEPEDDQEESPFSLTASESPSLFDTLDSDTDDIPDLDIPNAVTDQDDDDDESDIDSLIFALEDDQK